MRIHFPDGSHEDIIIPHANFDSTADEERVAMERILRERLGDEMANWFDRLADYVIDETAQKCYDPEANHYELDCDNYRQILSAVQMELIAIRDAITLSRRVTRQELGRALDRQVKVINDTL